MHCDTSQGITHSKTCKSTGNDLQFLLSSTCHMSSVLSAVVLHLDQSGEFTTTHVGRAFSA